MTPSGEHPTPRFRKTRLRRKATSGNALDATRRTTMRLIGFLGLLALISAASPSAAQFDRNERWDNKTRPSVEKTQTEAQAGSADAQNQLGTRYYKGDGVPKSLANAERFYRQAAEQGHVGAQNNLGLIYSRNMGPKGYPRAVYWYRKAASLGSEVAQYNLGLMYRYGKGVKRDYQEAARWIEYSAIAGYPIAQNSIAHMYRKGMGVQRDTEKAIRWYELAAIQDFPVAQFNLGKYYLTRYISTPTNEVHTAAMRWLKAASENQEVDAQGTLGSVYERGYGVPINYPLAWMWFSLATKNGSVKARRRMIALESKMKSDERRLAREMLADWRRWVHADDR